MTDLPTALVIDDERQIRRLLRVVLESEYQVFESENARQGLLDIASRRPDVVLLDLALPDLDGTEVLKRLREWSRVPVLVLSVREGLTTRSRHSTTELTTTSRNLFNRANCWLDCGRFNVARWSVGGAAISGGPFGNQFHKPHGHCQR